MPAVAHRSFAIPEPVLRGVTRAPGVNQDPQVIADIARQVWATENHLISRFPHFQDDITQEVWVAALGSVKYYDREKPGARGFFYRVANLWVAEHINRWLAVTSLSRQEARGGVGATQYPVDLDHARGCTVGAEDELARAEDHAALLRRLAHLRVKWRRAVDAALVDVDAKDAEVGALVYGLDGPAKTSGAVARATGLWRDDVEEMAARFRQALRRAPAVANLEKQIAQIEGELP